MKKFAFILVTALAMLFSTALRADDYPTRPITLAHFPAALAISAPN